MVGRLDFWAPFFVTPFTAFAARTASPLRFAYFPSLIRFLGVYRKAVIGDS